MLKITLDTNALESLFPEGSEARIELKQYAINEITQRLIVNGFNNSLDEKVEEIAENFVKEQGFENLDKVIKKHIETYFASKVDYFCPKKLTENGNEAAKLIADKAKRLVNDMVMDTAANLVNEKLDSITNKETIIKTVKNYLSYKDSEINDMVKKVVNNNLGMIITEIVNERIK